MNCLIEGNDIIIHIPANNAGKFRFKKRENRFSFGKTFSTREDLFDKDAYLEWQIGYSIPVENNKKVKIDPKLTNKSFVGSDGRAKYPYELSEIFFKAMELKLISIEKVKLLHRKIRSYNDFIDKLPITVEPIKEAPQLILNDIQFEGTNIKLPTLFIENSDKTLIEVSIQKQQYATGIQPMIYFCIPLESFKNYKHFIGKSSRPHDILKYVINGSNVSNIIHLMKVFGMASKRHNYDVSKILEFLLDTIERE